MRHTLLGRIDRELTTEQIAEAEAEEAAQMALRSRKGRRSNLSEAERAAVAEAAEAAAEAEAAIAAAAAAAEAAEEAAEAAAEEADEGGSRGSFVLLSASSVEAAAEVEAMAAEAAEAAAAGEEEEEAEAANNRLIECVCVRERTVARTVEMLMKSARRPGARDTDGGSERTTSSGWARKARGTVERGRTARAPPSLRETQDGETRGGAHAHRDPNPPHPTASGGFIIEHLLPPYTRMCKGKKTRLQLSHVGNISY